MIVYFRSLAVLTVGGEFVGIFFFEGVDGGDDCPHLFIYHRSRQAGNGWGTTL
jgi:hypothetical protein